MSAWELSDNQLKKTFEFQSFEAAMDFMQRASGVIAALDHHPEWTNVYNRVHVSLCTHGQTNSQSFRIKMDSLEMNFQLLLELV